MWDYIPCYLTIKKKEILPFATVWMDLKGVILNDPSQRETETVGSHSCRGLKKPNSKRESMVVSRARGWANV